MLQLASILVLGIFAQWFAWRVKKPAILPLIIIGLAIGPLSSLFTPDGQKLIDGDAIFTGDLLFSFVQISVGVILFEGGLTLNLKEIKSLAGTVRNLLIMGTIITFVGGGLAAHYLLGMSLRMAFLFGSLIIVSGPTVIMPILRNVKPNTKINTLLKWEGILIDPFGALVAVLAYELIISSKSSNEYTLDALKEFFVTVSAGVFAGGIGALLLWYLIKKNLIPDYLRNVFTLGLVIFTFSGVELVQKEAGLMAATFMGIVLANVKMEEIKKILSFKEDVSLILISVLFILLSSRINMEQITRLGWQSLVLFLVVILVLRPLAVWLSTFRSNLNWREKLFISWIGPKGIVAAAVASLFSLDLLHSGKTVNLEEAQMLLPLTFLIIVGTVIIQGSSAKWVAKKLKVTRKEPQGVLFVGANEVARKLALRLKQEGFFVLLADTSKPSVRETRKLDLPVYEGNVLSEEIFDDLDLSGIGKLAAITSNSGVNALACQWFSSELGENHVYRLVSKEESENLNLPLAKNVLFNSRTDFLSLSQLMRKNGEIAEKTFENEEEFTEFMESKKKRMIPLFLIKESGKLHIVTGYPLEGGKGDRLLFLKTKNFEMENLEHHSGDEE